MVGYAVHSFSLTLPESCKIYVSSSFPSTPNIFGENSWSTNSQVLDLLLLAKVLFEGSSCSCQMIILSHLLLAKVIRWPPTLLLLKVHFTKCFSYTGKNGISFCSNTHSRWWPTQPFKKARYNWVFMGWIIDRKQVLFGVNNSFLDPVCLFLRAREHCTICLLRSCCLGPLLVLADNPPWTDARSEFARRGFARCWSANGARRGDACSRFPTGLLGSTYFFSSGQASLSWERDEAGTLLCKCTFVCITYILLICCIHVDVYFQTFNHLK